MLLLTGEESRLPLYYRMVPGSIKDVSTLKGSPEDFILTGSGKMNLVMDKGSYSEANVDAMYAKHMKFMIGVPFTAALAKKPWKMPGRISAHTTITAWLWTMNYML